MHFIRVYIWIFVKLVSLSLMIIFLYHNNQIQILGNFKYATVQVQNFFHTRENGRKTKILTIFFNKVSKIFSNLMSFVTNGLRCKVYSEVTFYKTFTELRCQLLQQLVVRLYHIYSFPDALLAPKMWAEDQAILKSHLLNVELIRYICIP